MQTEHMHLHELLPAQPDVVRVLTNPTAYAHCRKHYATLRSFERRLRALYTESLEKCQNAGREIATLDTTQPTHRMQYRTRYEGALRESGIDPNEVRLMRFIEP